MCYPVLLLYAFTVIWYVPTWYSFFHHTVHTSACTFSHLCYGVYLQGEPGSNGADGLPGPPGERVSVTVTV